MKWSPKGKPARDTCPSGHYPGRYTESESRQSLPEGSEKLAKILRGGTISIISAPQGVFQPLAQTGTVMTGHVIVHDRVGDPVELLVQTGTARPEGK